MKKKAKFELVIEEEKEIDGKKCYVGFVGVNGQLFRFWNLPIEGVGRHFLRTAEFRLKEMEAEEEKKGV